MIPASRAVLRLLLLLLLHEDPASNVSWNFGRTDPELLLLLLELLDLKRKEDSEEKLLLNPDETDEDCWLLFWLFQLEEVELLLFHPCALELHWFHPW